MVHINTVKRHVNAANHHANTAKRQSGMHDGGTTLLDVLPTPPNNYFERQNSEEPPVYAVLVRRRNMIWR